jgi:hypothetical protein
LGERAVCKVSRSVELRLVVENRNGPAPNVDLKLLKAVARAQRWFAEVSSGENAVAYPHRGARGRSRKVCEPLIEGQIAGDDDRAAFVALAEISKSNSAPVSESGM